ncbi:succinate dehydrogenase, hydrophobic membrane anchor protein [Rhodoplanes sp. TEM]|uniref:Succinate dehydrogenase hydrophobic membrane anchor subunit n=1 Tax=Rhodoplanes tepidamans TaxID=200616 RepID=A0ABT5J8P2_RHOTP|nr:MULTISPECIES: succinate dehydrogenase, hydrophobic membrane anchor protein [Rhodoplanes]MDC7786025.1 succinate dehydrogenase, hydrophobic membrane anchor protein [Rhodoplanes tepidamans]MDC7983834.1 succinate dehydrogenase, hydrophobic membrane anchor protein [Rhodoplanes sp. TEM]MDQ0354867.1 succinate dehydrogenase / fumarate reductase membrane anchor subunit [Rhodoplanes tepidamans]
MKSTSIRTPIGKVRGLGSAKSGTEHWWEMRLTSIALLPLTLAAIVIVISLIGRNHAAVVQILGSPLVAITMLLWVYTVTLHMRLGLQSVIEDYIHGKAMKTGLLIGNTFLTIVLWLACTYAILKLSFGV